MTQTFSVQVTAPTRIDLVGGTLDLWPIHQVIKKAATINFGITLNATTGLKVLPQSHFEFLSHDQNLKFTGSWQNLLKETPLPLIQKLVTALWSPDMPGLRIATRALSPAGAGLGGSSALAITVAWALFQARKHLNKEALPTEHALVDIVKDIESELIYAPTGCQDYWGAIKGGMNLLEYPPGQTKVTKIADALLTNLESHLIVCYSGQSRQSAMNNWQIFKDLFDRKQQTIDLVEALGAVSIEATKHLKRQNFAGLMECTAKDWKLRCQLWPGVETAVTQKISQAAIQGGAFLTKVCGAGGGGVMAIFAEPAQHQQVKAAITNAGGEVLDKACIAKDGLRVIRS